MKFCSVCLLLFSLSLAVPAVAQELNVTVRVNDTRAQTTVEQVFRIMETEFADFYNNRKWTEDVFEQQERLNINLVITIRQMPNVGQFQADVQVQTSRPVYGSNYESLVMNFADRQWEFLYNESQPLQFAENRFISNITSMLAYYAYMALGMDYDTFSEKGGSIFFQRALDIVNFAQPSGAAGWDQFENTRNRYWLVNDMLNPQMEAVRQAMYLYHRKGLDVMGQDPEEGRKAVIEALELVQEANQTKPNSIVVIAFLDAKAPELLKMFTNAPLTERRKVYTLLAQISPQKSGEFRALVE